MAIPDWVAHNGGMYPPLPFASDDTPVVRPPRLPGRVIMRGTSDDAIDAVLADIFMQAMSCVGAFGDFQFAVSVTPAVEPVLRRMLFDLSLRAFPWQKTRLWLTDELALPESDPSRRGVSLREYIVEQSGIPEEQVHVIEAWKPDASEAYERTLREVLGWREKGHDRLDAVLCSIDDTGAVASGWTGSASLVAKDTLVVRDRSTGGVDEVKMSLEFLNASRMLAVLATGRSVKPALLEIESAHRAGAAAGCNAPAGRLSPKGGELRWYLDAESW